MRRHPQSGLGPEITATPSIRARPRLLRPIIVDEPKVRVLLRGSRQHPELPQGIQDGAPDASLRVEGVDVAAQESGRERVLPPARRLS